MAMKLVVTIVQNEDADSLVEGLTAAHFGATRMASTGGFLRQGNTTIIVGVPEESVDKVLQIIEESGKNRRNAVVNPFPGNSITNRQNDMTKSGSLNDIIAQSLGAATETQPGRATVFVLNLDRYERV